jgi:nitrate reductase cytochrome c-type subunit
MAAPFFRRIAFAALIALIAPSSDGAAETDAPAAPQPPLVTHAMDGYRIGRDLNECVACHEPPGHEKAGAKKMSDAHYVYRQGERLDKIAATRFYCNQCHKAAPNAKPLAGARP